MLSDLHLLAIVRNRKQTTLARMPLEKPVHNNLEKSWTSSYESFISHLNQIDYRPGRQLESNQCFRFLDYDLPQWLAKQTIKTARYIDVMHDIPRIYNLIQGTVVLARDDNDKELMLFQDFSQSNVIAPGHILQLEGDIYKIIEHRGLLLERKLCAVYMSSERRLLFSNFRAVNSFLPIFEFYKKVSEQEIREVLKNSIFVAEAPDTWARDANQWFRTRFSQLIDTGILERYSAEELKSRSKGYDVSIQIVNDKVLFPSDQDSAKRLLQFLSEELYKGAVTDTNYVATSKFELKTNQQ